jgi:hypothetical protein
MLSIKRINKVYNNNKDMFDDLENFDKTRSFRTKQYANFSIDKSILKKFRDYCKKNHINMSNMIESYMKKVSDGRKQRNMD